MHAGLNLTKAKPRKDGKRPDVTFMAHDPGLLAILPEDLRSVCNCYLTHRAGISKEVADDIRLSVTSGNFSQTAKKLRKKYMTAHYQKLRDYSSFLKYATRHTLLGFHPSYLQPGRDALVDLPTRIPPTPSVDYLIRLYLDNHDFVKQRQLGLKMFSSLPIRFLKFDHTFKSADKWRGPDGEQVAEAIAIALNEYSQVVGYYMVKSTSLDDLEFPISLLSQRCLALANEV
jgi:hypothetical protein